MRLWYFINHHGCDALHESSAGSTEALLHRKAEVPRDPDGNYIRKAQ